MTPDFWKSVPSKATACYAHTWLPKQQVRHNILQQSGNSIGRDSSASRALKCQRKSTINNAMQWSMWVSRHIVIATGKLQTIKKHYKQTTTTVSEHVKLRECAVDQSVRDLMSPRAFVSNTGAYGRLRAVLRLSCFRISYLLHKKVTLKQVTRDASTLIYSCYNRLLLNFI